MGQARCVRGIERSKDVVGPLRRAYGPHRRYACPLTARRTFVVMASCAATGVRIRAPSAHAADSERCGHADLPHWACPLLSGARVTRRGQG
jgi:hypothetical protein